MDPEHLDHQNLHTFEVADLQKLILKTSDDLSAADNQRRQEFKVLHNYNIKSRKCLIDYFFFCLGI